MANHPAITGRRHPKVLEEVFTTIVPRGILVKYYHNVLILLGKNVVSFPGRENAAKVGRSM
jgi:hypothetical protein